MPSPEFELREQDRWLPIANVARLMKNTLPETAKVSKDAKDCMQECVSEFISFVTSEASDRCLMEKRKTINGEDVLYSLHTLGFENYAEVLKIYLAKYRQEQALRQERGEIRTKKKKKKVVIEGDAGQVGGLMETNNGISNTGIDDAGSVAAAAAAAVEAIQRSHSGVGGEMDQEGDLTPLDEGHHNHQMEDEDIRRHHASIGVDDNNNSNDNDNNNNGNGSKSKSDYDQEYVSQLYEQGYADLPLSLPNPDYHGGGASEGIVVKHQTEGGADVEERDDHHVSNGGGHGDNGGTGTVSPEDDKLGLDLEVGVGVNIHLGNTTSMDVINDRLNHEAHEHPMPIPMPTSNGNGTTEHMVSTDILHDEDGSNDDMSTRKTPATTSTNELLLLDDNIAGVSEREEIVGLTNGHSGMYPFE